MKTQTSWMFFVLCMFVALICYIEWSHTMTRRFIGVVGTCIDIRFDEIANKDVRRKLDTLRGMLRDLGLKTDVIRDLIPYDADKPDGQPHPKE